MVEHIRQNRLKYVPHPQVLFVLIQYERLVEADQLRRVTDLAFGNQRLTVSYFAHLVGGEIRANVCKTHIRGGQAKV